MIYWSFEGVPECSLEFSGLINLGRLLYLEAIAYFREGLPTSIWVDCTADSRPVDRRGDLFGRAS